LLRVHYNNATEAQIETFNKALSILQENTRRNDAAKAYFKKFGLDIEELLTPCKGPHVYVGGESKYRGEYNPLTNSIRIYDKTLTGTLSTASSIIHELGHYANDAAKRFGTLDPGINDVPTFKNPNPSDGPYGYAAEVVTFGKFYTIGK
jgi:hypothetical protein